MCVCTGVPTAWIERAFWYDKLGRLVQTVEKNAMGTTSRTSSKYDFLGNVTTSREQHGTDYKSSTFTYDGRGRLTGETASVNGGTAATMAYAYDPLGRLKTTTSGSGTGAVATTDSWNIQGWLTGRTALKGTTNIFSMSLGYYTPTLSGPSAKYSGDISSWTWTQSGQGAKSYGSIVEQNDYYPFGTRHPNGLTTLSANRWRFSGKEEQDGFGIAYSDFGARLYDRSTAWISIDPLAEKYYSVSPYAYCVNNPVRFVDPNGTRVVIWYKDDNGIARSFSYSGGAVKHANSFVNSVIEAYYYNKVN